MSDDSLPAGRSRRQRRLDSEASDSRPKRGALLFLRDMIVIIVIALLVSFLVKTFVVRSFYIPSGSMENTLLVNDRILVDELSPNFNGYHRGDIVVFTDPGGWLPGEAPTPSRGPVVDSAEWVLSLVGLAAPDSSNHLIKRIIGLPGDHVKCCNALGQVEVNGTPIDESAYLRLQPGATEPTPRPYDVVVPPNSIWVLGDNRDESRDSRYNTDGPTHGFVPMDNIVGRAFVRTWPMDRLGGLGDIGDTFATVPAPDADPTRK